MAGGGAQRSCCHAHHMPHLLFLHSPIQLTTLHNNQRQPRRQNSRLQYSPQKNNKNKKTTDRNRGELSGGKGEGTRRKEEEEGPKKNKKQKTLKKELPFLPTNSSEERRGEERRRPEQTTKIQNSKSPLQKEVHKLELEKRKTPTPRNESECNTRQKGRNPKPRLLK